MPWWRCKVPVHVRNRPLVQMLVVGIVGVAIIIPIAAVDPVVSDGRLGPGVALPDALRRSAGRDDPDLRAGRDRHRVLDLEVPDEAGRGGEGRSADPWQHPPRGGLDGSAGGPHRGPVRLCLLRPALQREDPPRRDGGQRHRAPVRVRVLLPAVSGQADRQLGALPAQTAGRSSSGCAPST